VLLGQATYDLVREAVAAVPAGEIEAKGKSRPLVPWRLLGLRPDVPGMHRSGRPRARGCSRTEARPGRLSRWPARAAASLEGGDDITTRAELLVDLAEVLRAHGDVVAAGDALANARCTRSRATCCPPTGVERLLAALGLSGPQPDATSAT